MQTLVKIVKRDYWTTEDMTPKQQQKLNTLYMYILKLQSIYNLVFLVAAWSYALNVYLKREEIFVFNIWIPKFLLESVTTSPYHEIIFIFQFTVLLVTLMGGVLPYDLLFISFVATTIIQLKMLKYKLHTVGTVENKSKFKYMAKCIRHHNILLR